MLYYIFMCMCGLHFFVTISQPYRAVCSRSHGKEQTSGKSLVYTLTLTFSLTAIYGYYIEGLYEKLSCGNVVS